MKLIMKSIKKCVFLILKRFFVTAHDDIFTHVALFVLSNFFKGSWKCLRPSCLSIFDGLIIALLVYFEGSKGSIDHTVNY
jgi:hypothetical protein